jgi:hypothetical protein
MEGGQQLEPPLKTPAEPQAVAASQRNGSKAANMILVRRISLWTASPTKCSI